MFITNPPKEGGYNNGGGMGFLASLGIGGLIQGMQAGGSYLDYYLNRDASEDAFEKSLHHSKRAIRDRVIDAEKAGIHPLYALGASTTTPSPMVFESTMGQQIGQSLSRNLDINERMRQQKEGLMLDAQIAKTNSEKAMIDQEKILALDRHLADALNTKGIPGLTRDPGFGDSVTGQHDSGLYQYDPPKRSTSPSGQRGVESGAIPGFQKYTLPGGKGGSSIEALLPSTDEGLSEVPENIPWYMWPTIYAVNKRHYGKEHADKLLDWANPFK